MTDLSELIERIEAASGPDRELDAEIALAIGWTLRTPKDLRFEYWFSPNGERVNPGRFTSSLDAAITLVPDGHIWEVESHPRGLVAWCYDKEVHNSGPSLAATPALALCAAALKAREAM